jgi:four helix bundle protein
MGTVSYTQLDVWKKAHELALATYRATEAYPAKEQQRMTDQSCRAAVSVAANIAEGYGRRKPRDKMRFYTHSEGSLQELRYYFILARDLGYLGQTERLFQLVVDVESMLRKLIAAIESSLPKSTA